MTRAVFYRSIGPELAVFEIDIAGAALKLRGTVTTPGVNIQYAWPHPSQPFLYVVASDGGPGFIPGTTHIACAFRVDPATGTLVRHGAPAALPSRPIHCCVDAAGAFLLTAYNFPSNVTVHRIAPDGGVGTQVAQSNLDSGTFAHQVRMTPRNMCAILVTRGNHAADGKPEDPGALKVFRFADGVLMPQASLAPDDGFGFGPRHLDFHPTAPWVFVVVERQSELHVYRMNADDTLAPGMFVRSTLADGGNNEPAQMAGAIHVHPNGRYVYVTNRNSSTVTVRGRPVFDAGENNIAVFAIDSRSGEPTLIQHIEACTNHLRTFAIDPGGELLIAASVLPIALRDGTTLAAALVVYRIDQDGRLTFVRKYDVETGPWQQFWSGIVPLLVAAPPIPNR